jgi:hypothetical protein
VVLAWATACAPGGGQPSLVVPPGHGQPLENAGREQDAGGERAEAGAVSEGKVEAETAPPDDDASGESGESSAEDALTSEALVCRHIVGLVAAESEAPAEGEQRRELLASCELALVYELRELDEAERERRITCVLAAGSVAELHACGPS